MTPQQKQKRYAYAKNRRQRLNAEMRKAGIIGAPRPKMSEEERKGKRKTYSHDYNTRIRAEAKAFRELQEQEKAAPTSQKVSRRRKSS